MSPALERVTGERVGSQRIRKEPKVGEGASKSPLPRTPTACALTQPKSLAKPHCAIGQGEPNRGHCPARDTTSPRAVRPGLLPSPRTQRMERMVRVWR